MKKIAALLLGILLLIPVVSLSGCMGAQEEAQPQETAAKTVVIRTSGATFPKYQIQKWIAEYQKINPNVKIEQISYLYLLN